MAQHFACGSRQGAVCPHLITDLAGHALYERIIKCGALRMLKVGAIRQGQRAVGAGARRSATAIGEDSCDLIRSTATAG